MQVYRYEDMKDDLKAVIRKVATFLGKEVSCEHTPGLLDVKVGEADVEKLVAFLDINKMRANPMVRLDGGWDGAECLDCRLTRRWRSLRVRRLPAL